MGRDALRGRRRGEGAAVSVKITLELERNHARALLRLCNKITHSDALAYLYPHVPLGVRNDQAYDVIHATIWLAEALCDNGANEFPWIESGSAE